MHPAIWRIVPLATPRLLRRCSRCDVQRPFASSDRFRLNANGRKVDVWLVYRCESCGISWNRTVLERRTPEEMGLDLYRRYESNDTDLAWKHAFDVAGVATADDVPFRIDRSGNDVQAIVLQVPWPVGVRLDRLLSRELGIPRSRLERLFDRRTLRRPVRDGQIVEIGPTRA